MSFDVSTFHITGTYIWYYCICKREVWLLSRGITADQDNTYMDIGRFLHEKSYSRERKEIDFHGMKLDLVKHENGRLVIGEIKKTSKYMDSARMQLLHYMSELESDGIQAEGILMFPEEKKRETVMFDNEARKKLEEVKTGIINIVDKDKPPAPQKVNYCKSCAYSEMCWA